MTGLAIPLTVVLVACAAVALAPLVCWTVEATTRRRVPRRGVTAILVPR